MAEYSTNYTQNTTDIANGTETYKFSRVVSTVNPDTLDNSCIYCGSDTPVKYDYYPCNMYTGDKLTLMNSVWSVTGNKFNFTDNSKDSNFNIAFALCDYSSTVQNSGINSVYQIGKTIYNEGSSSSASNIRILNPTDIRKFLFRPQFDGYLGTSNSLTSNVDIKYLMEHSDEFYVTAIRMNSIFWNGSNYTSTPTRLERIRPCIIGEDYFLPLTTCLAQHAFQTTDYNTQKYYTQSFYGAYDSDGMGIDFFPIESNEEVTFTQDPATTNVITDNGNKYHSSYNFYVSNYNLFSPAKQVLKLLAYCGCYFVDSSYNTSGKTLNTFWNDEHIYLGEMKEGARTTGVFIKGTDLLTSDTINKGEYSSQTDFDPSPSPSPSGDDAEAETFGWGGNEVAGMVRYYLLSQSEMEELQAFMSDASWRMDYRNCIIGMYVVPNGGLFFDAPVPTTLKFRIGLNEAEGVIPQDQELDTGISCLRISGVVNNESSVIELPRINGNFLDFEPYSKYMVYVPFCGVIPLPDYVAGKEIKVTIYPDVPTCTCTAVVTSEGRKIATAKGAYGSQLPVTSDGDGLKAASVINSLGNIIMGAGEVALGIGTGMVPLAIVGGAQMLGSGLQADLQLGQAYGYSIGASGDTSFFGAGNRCEYYVAYSKWNNPDVDDGELQTNIYGHTYGFVCNKRGVLKDFEGFTVCDNPHVYGFSCTSDEKDEIERLLREGIIIHMSEE